MELDTSTKKQLRMIVRDSRSNEKVIERLESLLKKERKLSYNKGLKAGYKLLKQHLSERVKGFLI
jgi:hypothetical protein